VHAPASRRRTLSAHSGQTAINRVCRTGKTLWCPVVPEVKVIFACAVGTRCTGVGVAEIRALPAQTPCGYNPMSRPAHSAWQSANDGIYIGAVEQVAHLEPALKKNGGTGTHISPLCRRG